MRTFLIEMGKERLSSGTLCWETKASEH